MWCVPIIFRLEKHVDTEEIFEAQLCVANGLVTFLLCDIFVSLVVNINLT